MDRELYSYCLGAAKSPRSESGKAVQRLVASASQSRDADDGELLRMLSAILSQSPALEDDVFPLLKPLHGCGGSEGYVLDVDPAVESGFWNSLAEKFPDRQGLVYVAADAALLAGDRDAARRGEPEEMAEIMADLANEFRDAPEKLKIINDVACGGDVPREE